MKKITLKMLIIGLCFSQTGFITKKGESAFGIWAETYRPIECDCEPVNSFYFDYMTKFGLEIGLGMGTSTIESFDADVENAHLTYHFQSPNGANYSFGYKIEEVTADLGFTEFSLSTDYYELSLYSDNAFVCTISHYKMENAIASGEILSWEKYFTIGRVAKFGMSYKIDTDTIKDMLEDEDLEYLKEGRITLTLGATF